MEPKDIIEKIKKENIQPKPKWKAVFRNYAYWIFLVLMTIFGSAVFAMVLANILDLRLGMVWGWRLDRYFRLLVLSLPLTWLFLGLVALVFGILAFRKTKHGYRYRNLFVVTISVLIISMLAVFCHFGNFSRRIESAFERTVPENLHRMMPPREMRFFHPEEGIIAGRIFQVGDEYFILSNHWQEDWTVLMQDDTEMVDIEKLEKGLRVFVSGQEVGKNTFQAEVVRRLEPPRTGHEEFRSKTDRPGMGRKN